MAARISRIQSRISHPNSAKLELDWNLKVSKVMMKKPFVEPSVFFIGSSLVTGHVPIPTSSLQLSLTLTLT